MPSPCSGCLLKGILSPLMPLQELKFRCHNEGQEAIFYVTRPDPQLNPLTVDSSKEASSAIASLQAQFHTISALLGRIRQRAEGAGRSEKRQLHTSPWGYSLTLKRVSQQKGTDGKVSSISQQIVCWNQEPNYCTLPIQVASHTQRLPKPTRPGLHKTISNMPFLDCFP
uniref:Predicted gene 7489 n=1 Tax=Mus spicilegus TaxID=10103 RepID=A0A8C6HU52_MUSSI